MTSEGNGKWGDGDRPVPVVRVLSGEPLVTLKGLTSTRERGYLPSVTPQCLQGSAYGVASLGRK